MALEIIGMYAAITGGTEDAVAQIDIPQSGIIRAIDWDVKADMDADSEFLNVEFSFIAVNQLSINDVRGRISSLSTQVAVLTAVGLNSVGINKFVGPFELMVAGGERMYIHSVTTAGVTGSIRLNLHFDGGATVTRRSARR